MLDDVGIELASTIENFLAGTPNKHDDMAFSLHDYVVFCKEGEWDRMVFHRHGHADYEIRIRKLDQPYNLQEEN